MQNLPTNLNFSHIPQTEVQDFGKQVISLMSLAGVNTGRATHYNTKEEKEEAEKKIHFDVFSKDRGVYAAVHCMPGVTDYSKQKAVTAMLANSWFNQGNSVLTQDTETSLIKNIVSDLPANRMLNLFCQLRDQRINNTRTKKRVILTTLLGVNNLAWWSVKYRNKMRKSLEHCWGKRRTSILKNLLTLTQPNEQGIKFIDDHILVYAKNPKEAVNCVRFILGCPIDVNSDDTPGIIKAFYDAKQDIKKGSVLPIEVLEGIRSTYHKDVKMADLMEVAKKNLTAKKKRLVQKTAKKAGVKVKFDPMSASATELYIYAFEMGMTKEIQRALTAKAKKIAESLPFYNYNKIGILVDDSFSMSGHETQKLRPLAITYVIRDVLMHLGESYEIEYATGVNLPFHKPRGGTDLATGLVNLAMKEVNSVFIISDGYENQPSGRISEILTAFTRLGIFIPIYHLNPVAAAETGKGLRHLSPDLPMMPISNPSSLAANMLMPMLESDPLQALSSIVNNAVKLIA